MRFGHILRTYRSPRLWNPIPHQNPRVVSTDEAVSTINSDTDVFVHSYAATPTELLEALCRRVKSSGLNDIRLNHILLKGPIPWAQEEYWGKIRSNCLFLDSGTRPLVKQGKADYVPVFLSDIPRLYYSGFYPVDVALISVSPPDHRGFCSMGVSIDSSFSATSMAKKIIALINPSMPRIAGDGMIHISHFDALVETNRPIYDKEEGSPPDEVATQIGMIIAEKLVDNGATLQMGIGGIPEATLHALKSHKDLGVHTEFLTEGVVDLMEMGVVNNQKKTVLPGKTVSSFAFGTRKFYDLLHDNPCIYFGCCGWTNHTDVVRENHKMTSVNSALEIDLTGQICSDSIGYNFFSGFGGQMDFMSAAGAAKDGKGKAIIAIPSRTGKGKSKIVPTLSEGAGVVTTRGHIHYVVTEYGIAELWGRNVRQRARALIDIAHPEDREKLEKAAFDRLKCMPSK